MRKTKLSLLTALVLSSVLLVGAGTKSYTFDKDYKTMYEDLQKEGRLDNKETSLVSSWCNTIIKDNVTWACMDEEYKSYQVNIKTDYVAEDLMDIMKDLTDNVSYLNANPLKDFYSTETIYVKYLGKDGDELVEFVVTKKDSDFMIGTYTINLQYLDTFNEVLKKNGL